MTRTFVAPGKLMLAGEYTVLGPAGEALAIAVEPGIEAVATPSSQWRIERAPEGICWSEGDPVPEELGFAQAAWGEALRSLDAPPHRIVTRTRGAADVRGKPGLGGSASAVAVVTATVYGLAGRTLDEHREEILDVALRAHRRVQQGRGSGYDVATVVHGGLVHFRRPAEVRGLSWPAGLHLLAGYSGSSARTTHFLRQLDAVEDREVELRELQDATRRLVLALEGADIVGIVDQVRICHAALESWDARRGLGIVTPEIQRMVALAESEGAAAKVSGAGGGDSVIALASDRAALDRIDRLWRDNGFFRLALEMGLEGVREP